MINDDSQPQYLILGKILRPHGVRGELKMQIMTDYPERLADNIKTIYLGKSPEATETLEPHHVKSARFHKDSLLLMLSNISDRNEAEMLRGKVVMIDIANAIPLEDDEFYLYELIGMTVQTDEIVLGQVHDVIETGANDVYVVKSREYGELLVPAHDETLVDFDFDSNIITMKLPDGLLPDNS